MQENMGENRMPIANDCLCPWRCVSLGRPLQAHVLVAVPLLWVLPVSLSLSVAVALDADRRLAGGRVIWPANFACWQRGRLSCPVARGTRQAPQKWT